MRAYFEFDAYFKFKICSLVWVLNILYLMHEDGQYGRNMSNVLAGLIKHVVVYSSTYGSF